jgi:hypothetical protein
VLRVPSGGSSSPMVGSRENRGKARQFTTFNGRTVVVKDSWVYSNKGASFLPSAEEEVGKVGLPVVSLERGGKGRSAGQP